jgi:dTDP-4-dehydrorhamnose 3,5-epimerase-like enzyme
MKVPQPTWIHQGRVIDSAGKLEILELPFQIKRMYYIHGVGSDSKRGFHAHKTLHQIFVVPQGSLQLELVTPNTTQIFKLNSNENRSLHVPPGYWRVLSSFSQDAIGLVLASEHYDETDYIRNFDEYVKWFNDVMVYES